MFLPREEADELFGKLDRKEATVLVGPRRAGKSTLAMQMLSLWKQIRGEGVFVDLEQPGPPQTFHDLDHAVSGLKKGSLVVLDEVQNVDGWEKWTRKTIEEEKYHFIITGSNSKLLSGEAATSLAGRAIPYKILTLSFRDFRKWSGNGIKEYLAMGGYPECVKRPEERKELLNTYFELAVLKDVAARYGMREVSALRSFATIALSEIGKKLNIPKTASRIGVSPPTARQFFAGLEAAFLILSVPAFDRSPRERETSLKKVYAYDLGMRSAVSISESEDIGRIWENAVAIELVRRGYSLSYLGGKNECDFLAEKMGERMAVQVCSEDDLPERELIGLEQGMRARPGSSGLLITPNMEESRECKYGKIKVIPLLKWLLEVL
ncbi:TPA: ATP-binding protein [Candidatus Micrarchaeota archaeon]|nr:ATP-binding protein [Candidatus Micrarchaeota archaeon]